LAPRIKIEIEGQEYPTPEPMDRPTGKFGLPANKMLPQGFRIDFFAFLPVRPYRCGGRALTVPQRN
jgi:hypothetical protein